MNRQMEMYNGKVYGAQVSEYGLEKGRLDYAALAEIVGPCILNGTVRDRTIEDWEIVSGDLIEYEIVCSDYIISQLGAKFLKEYTDELVLYNENLDLYIWGVTHWGTSWKYVLTDIELVEQVK